VRGAAALVVSGRRGRPAGYPSRCENLSKFSPDAATTLSFPQNFLPLQAPGCAAVKPPLKIAVAGLGTVGTGVLRLLQREADLLARRGGRRIVVAAVSARDRRLDRGIELSALRWYEDAAAMAADPEIEVVVEAIGGADGIARRVVDAALDHGKHVVTANKALIAQHGTALAARAEEKGLALSFEASVAGGIPVIKALREGLAGNRLAGVYGILNGTSNYILTTMRESGRDFAEVLAEAQKLGYAEADPSFDIDGVDAAHKLAILASVGFGRPIELGEVYAEGIRHISRLDIDFAEELGYRIKLLGIARLTDAGLEQRVHPCMVARTTPIAAVEGVDNAVVAEGDFVGRVVLQGRGAGAGPTASAVAADLVDIAAGRRTAPFGVPSADLRSIAGVPIERHQGAYYVRLMVVDQPGVIADVAAALRDQQVSMESMIQRGRAPGEAVPVVLTTHIAVEAAMRRALDRIAALDTVLEPPRMIRIEAF
jgi:homoserine dehydrogenase